MWSLGCALYKWTTGKEFAYVAAGARLQDTLHLVPPSWGDKASPLLCTLIRALRAIVLALVIYTALAASNREPLYDPARSRSKRCRC